MYIFYDVKITKVQRLFSSWILFDGLNAEFLCHSKVRNFSLTFLSVVIIHKSIFLRDQPLNTLWDGWEVGFDNEEKYFDFLFYFRPSLFAKSKFLCSWRFGVQTISLRFHLFVRGLVRFVERKFRKKFLKQTRIFFKSKNL